MAILPALFVRPQPNSPADKKRDINLLWGLSVPTTQIDNFAAGVNVDMIYGQTLAHEVGHVLGLNHRIATGDPFPDGITTPAQKNLMFPSANPPNENFDIIQAKAVRFSEVLRRNP